RIVVTADRGCTRRLMVAGEAVTPDDLHVRGVAHVDDDDVVFTANPIDDATVLHVWRWRSGGLEPLTDGPGVHGVAVGGGSVVIRTADLDHFGSTTAVVGGPTVASHSAVPLVTPNVE